MRGALAAALGALVLGLCLVAAVPGGARAAALPDCAPGTPAPPPPVPSVMGDRGSPTRIVAGRFFTIEYSDPALAVTVQDTILPPGTELDGADDGDFLTLALPAPGTIPLTARYYDSRNGTCVFSFTFTVAVEQGDLLRPGIGVGEDRLSRVPRLERLPRIGVNTDAPPLLGVGYLCTGTQARVPLALILRQERDLRRRPTEASPTLRIDVPDPCQTTDVVATSPGVVLRFVAGGPYVDEGDRVIGIEHRARGGRRYWLQLFQGTTLLGSVRYYVAFRPQNLSRPKLWVVAPDAAVARAACHRPPRDTPLGIHRYPLPPCRRR